MSESESIQSSMIDKFKLGDVIYDPYINDMKGPMYLYDPQLKFNVNVQPSPSTSTDETVIYPDVAGYNIVYKYNEAKHLADLKEYIDSTYSAHYAKSKMQATEIMIDAGYGEGFCMGSILKYWQRYGKKDGYNRKDLLKILHYAIIMLSIHDKKIEKGIDATK